jgi:hypothetical protein
VREGIVRWVNDTDPGAASDCFRTLMSAMATLEASWESCRLYAASATDKLAGMARNPAEMPDTETPVKAGVSSEQKTARVERRVSVAPMMDWSDDSQRPL